MANDTVTDSRERRISPDGLASPNADVSFLDLGILLAKRRRILGCASIAGALLATIFAVLSPNQYKAETTIIPPQQTQSSSAMMMLGQLGALGGLGLGGALQLKNPIDMYAAMIQSQGIETALINEYDLRSVYRVKRMVDARSDLESHTAVKVLAKEGMIRITVQDRDPRRATAMANSYVNELYKLNGRLALSEASQRRLFYEKELGQAKEDLAQAEIELKQTQQRTGMLQIDSQARAIIQAVAEIKAQIAAKEVQIQAMQSFATQNNPALQVVHEQLEGLKIQLAKLVKNNGDMVGDIQIPTTKVPELGLEYIRAFREVKYREAVFEILAKQFEAARLDEARDTAFIQVVDTATVPEKKSWPPRTLIVIAGLVGGFMLGALLVICLESYKKFQSVPGNQSRIALIRAYISGRL